MSKIARLIIVLILFVAVLPALPSSASEESFVIGLSLPNVNDVFLEGLNIGAHNAASEAGAELVVAVAEDDVETELANMESLIDQGANAILFRPVDPVLSVPALDMADAADVPVVLLGTLVVEADAEIQPVSLITGSNTEGGEMAAASLCEAVSGTGKVLELVGDPEAVTYARNESFEAAMAQSCPDVTLVPFETVDVEADALTEALVEAFRADKYVGVFGYDGAVTVAALEASIAARSRGTVFVGFDATEQSIAAVQGGRLRAVITPYASEMGEVGVQTSLAILNGEEVEDLVEVAVTVLDNSTIDAFRPRCRDPRGCD